MSPVIPVWLFEFAKPILEQGRLMYLAVGIRIVLGGIAFGGFPRLIVAP